MFGCGTFWLSNSLFGRSNDSYLDRLVTGDEHKSGTPKITWRRANDFDQPMSEILISKSDKLAEKCLAVGLVELQKMRSSMSYSRKVKRLIPTIMPGILFYITIQSPNWESFYSQHIVPSYFYLFISSHNSF